MSGNITARYKVSKGICPECNGTGEKFFSDKRKMIKYLWEDFFGRNFLKFVKDSIIDRGKNYYVVKCQNCKGRGIYEEWY